MKLITPKLGLWGICAFGACASPPTSSLMPDDVPVLYEAPENNLVSTSLCDQLQGEYEYLNEGLGEPPVETMLEARASIEDRIGSRLKRLVRSEINKQLGGALDIVNFVTDKKETERLLAVGKRRGLIRRAYIMGYMDASACDANQTDDFDFQIVSTDIDPGAPDHQVAGSMVFAETFSLEPAELDFGEDIGTDQHLNGESPMEREMARVMIAVDYVAADQEFIKVAQLSGGYLPAPDEVDADGMWPPKDALVYLDARAEKARKERARPGPDDVGADGLWPPLGTPGYE